MIRYSILTIFPRRVKAFFSEGLFSIAQQKKKIEIEVLNLRNWATDKHKSVDDRPFGGGPGMILKIEPIYRALEDLRLKHSQVWLPAPGGEILTQSTLENKSKALIKQENAHIILIPGYYEGVDHRVIENLVDWQFSLGRFILSNGEIPIFALLDGITRLIPGVLGNSDSPVDESFSTRDTIEYPQYTRPAEFRGWKVPEVLLRGDHQEIRKWRDKHKKKL